MSTTLPVTDRPPIISVRGLRKTYRIRGGADLVAVDDVSFSVTPGVSLAIVGESGSGKTTVARMLTGLETPDAGSITVAGQDRSRPARTVRGRRVRGRELQIVFQDPYTSLDPRQRVGACLAEVIRLHFRWPTAQVRARVHALSHMVGLDERQLRAHPGALSGGQRQRVAIARALAAEPQVVVLDESLAALDVSIQAQVLNLLADIRDATGVTYLLISHDLAVVRQITQQLLVMRGGVIIEAGPTAQVLDHPQHSYTQLLRRSVPRPGWKPLSSQVLPHPPTSPATTQEHP